MSDEHDIEPQGERNKVLPPSIRRESYNAGVNDCIMLLKKLAAEEVRSADTKKANLLGWLMSGIKDPDGIDKREHLKEIERVTGKVVFTLEASEAMFGLKKPLLRKDES